MEEGAGCLAARPSRRHRHLVCARRGRDAAGRAAAREAGIQRLVETTGAVRTVGFTEHPAADGMGFVVAVNYAPEKTAYPVRIDGRVKRVWNGECADGKLTIGANDGCVIQLEW